MMLEYEVAPTAAAANSASGGPVPTPVPPGGEPTTAGASPAGTTGSSASRAGRTGGGAGLTGDGGAGLTDGAGPGTLAGGRLTSWAAVPAAPAVHATKQVPSRIVLPFMAGSFAHTHRFGPENASSHAVVLSRDAPTGVMPEVSVERIGTLDLGNPALHMKQSK